ncbi:oxaloacetate decarboxylase [Pigmentiphaga soli]|uniref:Oxaloacetate decarboxylase n=1 Tax=Pigmentiphaga soli TaxID=1007095 RepID=A0ABP8GRG8_9BURK
MTEKLTTRLRRLTSQPDACVMAPGAGDAFMARMLARAGFEAVYMSGFATSVTRLGMSDVGLLTASEMLDNTWRIVDASGLPVLADIDTGYGNAMNVLRTVRDFEKAGAAALHMEDQVSPKRCGHLAGKRVIPAAEMVSKIKAACDARVDADLMLVIRTDAIAVEGIEAAFERAERYREAGADMLFIEAPVGREQTERVARHFKGVPLLYNMAASGKSPDIPADELGRMGFRLATFALYGLLAAIAPIERMLGELRRTGTIGHLRDSMATFKHLNEIVGLPEHQAAEARYGVPEDEQTRL